MSTTPSHGVLDDETHQYDAVLYLSFGGPEGPDDVIPFLNNVTAGRGVPPELLEEVAGHYRLFGGVSPINEANRKVIAALESELKEQGLDLPVYWANRNWSPFVADAVKAMADDGITRAICFVTSAYSSYSGCRQYREDLGAAVASVPGAPIIDKLRVFFDHPGFVQPLIDNATTALEAIPAERRAEARVLFTAHSIPTAMAETCSYVEQLSETCRLVSKGTGEHRWDLVWQSRSGSPQVSWLEPDISDHLETLAAEGVSDVVAVPVGFVADHLEVLFDLDVEAADSATRLDLNFVRARTVGNDPKYVRMIVELIQERMTADPTRAKLTTITPHDICAGDCCPAPLRGGDPRPAIAEVG